LLLLIDYVYYIHMNCVRYLLGFIRKECDRLNPVVKCAYNLMYLFMLINFFLFKLFVKKAKPLVKN
jgi:hypothetical protein